MPQQPPPAHGQGTQGQQSQGSGQNPPQAQPQGLMIPEEVKSQFGELVDLILKSESMNGEERQYWINILPIMTPDQIENLRSILVNEREQLAQIDKKYAKEVKKIGQKELVKQTAEQRRKKREKRQASEAKIVATDDQEAEALLQQIEQL